MTSQGLATMRLSRGKACRRRRIRPAALAAVASFALGFATINASAATKPSPSSAVKVAIGVRGDHLTARVIAKVGMVCGLRVAAGKGQLTLPRLRTNKAGKAAFTWYVPANAPSGIWTFTATCKEGKTVRVATRRVQLINHGNGNGPLAEPGTARVAQGSLGDLGGRGAADGCRPIVFGGNGLECFPNNPYNSYTCGGKCLPVGSLIGECTWYAVGRRPDLAGITTGNANQFLSQARARGVPTGTNPVVGAIAVRTEGTFGHVAYVTGIAADGKIIVDDANEKYDHNIYHGQRYPSSYFQGYIYGGPAGNGEGAGGGTQSTPWSGMPRIATVLTNGEAYVKEGGIDAGWVLVNGAVSQMALSGGRIGVLLADGNFFVKDGGIGSGWVLENGAVKQIALSGNRIGAVLTNGNAYVKEGGIDAGWVLVNGAVTQLTLSGSRIGVVLTNGNAYVKEGRIDAGWVLVNGPVKQLSLSGDRIGAVLTNGNAYVKEGGIDAGWVLVNGAVKQMVLSGNRIGVLLTDGNFFVKEGRVDSGWVLENGSGSQIALAGNRIGMLYTSGDAIVKEGGIDAGWVLVNGSVSALCLSESICGPGL